MKRTVCTLGLALSVALLAASSTVWCGEIPAVVKQAAARPATGLVDLGKEDLGKLRRAFNDSLGDVRMLLILSPSCPGCQEGSRDVQKQILDKIDFDHLKVFVVWFPLLDADNRDVAVRTSATFTDPRVSQFWMSDWTLGNLYGKVLPFPKDYKYHVAVDVYLIFDEKQTWRSDAVPKPASFMHRLGEDERLFKVETLRAMVEKQIKETVAKSACNCTAPQTGTPAKPPL